MNKDKLRYAILKEIFEGHTPLSENDIGVTEDQFNDAVNFLKREGYIIGVHYSDNRPQLFKLGPELTEKGENYLEENGTDRKSVV